MNQLKTFTKAPWVKYSHRTCRLLRPACEISGRTPTQWADGAYVMTPDDPESSQTLFLERDVAVC